MRYDSTASFIVGISVPLKRTPNFQFVNLILVTLGLSLACRISPSLFLSLSVTHTHTHTHIDCQLIIMSSLNPKRDSLVNTVPEKNTSEKIRDKIFSVILPPA